MRFVMLRWVGAWAMAGAGAWAVSPGLAWANPSQGKPLPGQATKAVTTSAITVAVVSVADDARHLPRQLEKRWPGQPQGRLLDAARLGLADAQLELQEAKLSVQLREAVADQASGLDKLLQQLHTERALIWLLDLPPELMPQALHTARQLGVLAINPSSPLDSLRSQGCDAMVLHTYPSQAMLADALAQYLAARSWRQVLVLQGPQPQDQVLTQAWQRAAQRYGIKNTQTRAFKFSSDPRERDAGNPRLLTADRQHEVVAVWDTEGDFARSLVYATQWPRLVVGSNGLVALAWHTQWERYGAPQLNRRFARQALRPMAGQDWAAWVGIKALVSAAAMPPTTTAPSPLATRLRSGEVRIDGFKGLPLSFRAWDGQLRQPIFLGHADGVAGTAPLDGVLHPVDTLDTLGREDKEQPCLKK